MVVNLQWEEYCLQMVNLAFSLCKKLSFAATCCGHKIRCLYWVFNNDCTPSTAETSKTLAKLLLYYNSLNKVTLPKLHYCAKFQTDVYCLI